MAVTTVSMEDVDLPGLHMGLVVQPNLAIMEAVAVLVAGLMIAEVVVAMEVMETTMPTVPDMVKDIQEEVPLVSADMTTEEDATIVIVTVTRDSMGNGAETEVALAVEEVLQIEKKVGI